MKCNYIYNGKEYTRKELYQLIQQGSLYQQISIQEETKWLEGVFGEEFSKRDIHVVNGLIENKVHGRFKSDGSIVLGSAAERGTSYHEAFHRIYRTILSEQEVKDLHEEFYKRKDAKALIEKYRTLYKGTEEYIVEEILAEEFRDYVINKQRMETPHKSFFDKIIDFLLEFFKLYDNRQKTKNIFDNIINGKYKSIKPKQYVGKDLNRVTFYTEEDASISLSIKDSNILLSSLRSTTLKLLREEGLIEDLVEGKISSSELLDFIFGFKHNNSIYYLAGKAYSKIIEGSNTYDTPLVRIMYSMNNFLNDARTNPESEDALKITNIANILFQLSENKDIRRKNIEFIQNLLDEFASIGISFEYIQEREEEAVIDENAGKDWAFLKPSIDIDDIKRLSARTKMLLASIQVDAKDFNKSESLLDSILNTGTNWQLLYNKFINRLVNLPNDTEIFKNELEKLSNEQSLVGNAAKIIFEYFIEDINNENVSLEEKKQKMNIFSSFMVDFNKTKYNYFYGRFKDNALEIGNAKRDTEKQNTIADWKASLADTVLVSYDANITSVYRYLNQYSEMFSKTGNSFRIIEENLYEAAEYLLGIVVKENEKTTEVKDYLIETLNLLINKVFTNSKETSQVLIGQYSDWVYSKTGGDIQGKLNVLAELLTPLDSFESNMVFTVEGNKIYDISLQTFHTLVANEINFYIKQPVEVLEEIVDRESYIVSDTTSDRMYNLREAVLKQKVPHIFNVYTQNSVWLNRILNGTPLEINIFEGVTTDDNTKKSEFSNLDEADLITMHLNAPIALSGSKNISIKHSDRSTIFTYNVGKNPIIEVGNILTEEDPIQGIKNIIKNKFIDIVKGYIIDENNKVRASKEDIFSLLFRYNKNKNTRSFFQGLNENNIGEFLDQLVKHEMDIVSNNMLVNPFPKEVIKRYGSYENAMYASVANYVVNSVEQFKLLFADPAIYKNAADAYKRFSTHSSTGTVMLTGSLINEYIELLNIEDHVKLLKLQEKYSIDEELNDELFWTKEIDGTATDVVFTEFESYKLHDERYKHLFKKVRNNIYNELIQEGLNEEEAQRKSVKMAEGFTKGYKDSINENDGMSWINMFEWKEYMVRAAKWTPGYDLLWDMELEIYAILLSTENTQERTDLINQVYQDAIEKYALQHNIRKSEASIKLFDHHGITPATSLKPQYSGPVYYTPNGKQEYVDTPANERIYNFGIRKTAYFPLMPSVVAGLHAEEALRWSTKHNVGILHMGSAAKAGTKLHMDIYKTNEEGNVIGFNDTIEDLTDYATYLDYKYMKDQVQIHTHEEGKILVATQSAKIVLSNLTNLIYDAQGDVKNQELKKHFDDYVESFTALTNQAIKELSEELNVVDNKIQDVQVFRDLLIREAKSRNSPINILNAIENFIESGYLELLSNRQKIESILMSVVSNNIINTKVNGVMTPQIPATLMDKKGSIRVAETKDGKVQKINASEEVPFYLDTNGNIIESGLQIPLPQAWIAPILRKYNFRLNLYEAINAINKEIEELNTYLTNLRNTNRKITRANLGDDFWSLYNITRIKGLRVPNQQTSSNDVFRVTKFFMPTTIQFAVVPSEIVVKAGSDFDIDKIFLYLNNITKDFIYKDPTNLSNIEHLYQIYKEEGLLPETVKTAGEIIEDENGNSVYTKAAQDSIKQRRKARFSIRELGDFIKNEIDIASEKINKNEIAVDTLKELMEFFKKNVVVSEDVLEELELYDSLYEFIEFIEDEHSLLFEEIQTIRMPTIADAVDTGVYDHEFKMKEDAIKFYEALLKAGYVAITHAAYEVGETTQELTELKDIYKFMKEKLHLRLDAEKNIILESVYQEKIKAFQEHINQNGIQKTKQINENIFNDASMQILLHESNFRNLVSPIDDVVLKPNEKVEESFGTKLYNLREKLHKLNSNEYENPWDEGSAIIKDFLSPSYNAFKTRIFVKSKQGVGIVATHIPNHSNNQAFNVKMNSYYVDSIGKVIPTRTLFNVDEEIKENGKYIKNANIGKVFDQDGLYIMDNYSVVLTSQVDAAKDPYALTLGINSQTFNTILFLMHRGVSLYSILLFVSQPVVQRYFKLMRIVNSVSTRQQYGNIPNYIIQHAAIHNQTIKEALDFIKKNSKGSKPIQESIEREFQNFYANLPAFTNEFLEESFTDKTTLDNVNRNKTLLNAFLHVNGVAKQYNIYKKSTSVDTSKKRNLHEVIDAEKTLALLKGKVTLPYIEDTYDEQNNLIRSGKLYQLIPEKSLRNLTENSILSSKFKGQEMYSMFKKFSFLENLKEYLDNDTKTYLENVISSFSNNTYTEENKLKFFSEISKALVLYLSSENILSNLNISDTTSLISGRKNLSSTIMSIKNKAPNNELVELILDNVDLKDLFKEAFAVRKSISEVYDFKTGKEIILDAVQLKNQNDTYSPNDYIEMLEILQYSEHDKLKQLYNEIVATHLIQTANNNSRFSFNMILPQNSDSGEIQAIKDTLKETIENPEIFNTFLIKEFIKVFIQNNPQYGTSFGTYKALYTSFQELYSSIKESNYINTDAIKNLFDARLLFEDLVIDSRTGNITSLQNIRISSASYKNYLDVQSPFFSEETLIDQLEFEKSERNEWKENKKAAQNKYGSVNQLMYEFLNHPELENYDTLHPMYKKLIAEEIFSGKYKIDNC